MLTARNVVALTIAIAVVSLISAFVSLLRPNDGGGVGGDSFGLRAHGHRGLFEILSELEIPVERSLVPPTAVLDRQATLVFWNPHSRLVAVEPAYLSAVKDWVEQGGRVVVAPDPSSLMRMLAGGMGAEGTMSLFERLGLSGVNSLSLDLSPRPGSTGPQRDGTEPIEKTADVADERMSVNLARVGELLTGRAGNSPTRLLPVSKTGEFEGWTGIEKLVVPEFGLTVLEAGDGTPPTGRITFQDDQGQEQTLVASYRMGRGRSWWRGRRFWRRTA
jgi:Domain of unknown function (DUF4350)